jgi:hypothetical protein
MTIFLQTLAQLVQVAALVKMISIDLKYESKYFLIV